MKSVVAYWLIGCFLVGFGAGLHVKRCPYETRISAQETFFSALIWPAGLIYAMSGVELAACKN